MSQQYQSIEREAARFVTNYSLADIDEVTLATVKWLIKDQFAIQIGASQLPWSRKTLQFRNPRPGRSTIVGETVTASAVDAAYLNASYGHGFEYDDFFDNAHPGCTVVPGAFALGEELGATLEDVLVALVTGYEAYVRIGRLGSPAVLNKGWQPHSLFGVFGAAALTARINGFDEETTFHALAISLSHISGPTEYASTGGSIKRIHAGICLRNGMESAELARAGITGPQRYLTGDRGFYRMFAQKEISDDAQSIFAPGTANFLPGLSYKPYCCCAGTFPFIEAMERFQDRADQIEWVDTRIQSMTDAIVGTRNAQIYDPRNIEELQYSLPAQMALAVLGRGNGYKTHRAFLEGQIDLTPGSAIHAMTQKMKLSVEKDYDERYPYFVADVTVHFKDGTNERYFQERAKGSPFRPYTPEEHQAKLDELTEEVIGLDQAHRLFALVDEMKLDRPVTDVTRLLVPQA